MLQEQTEREREIVGKLWPSVEHRLRHWLWRYHNFTRQAVFMFCPDSARLLSECRAAHKSKLNAFLRSSRKRNHGQSLQHVVTPGEARREGRGGKRTCPVAGQININHCVIIFCCQLNLSKVFIIHKCKTAFDKSFHPRSAPDRRQRRRRRSRCLFIVRLFAPTFWAWPRTQIHRSRLFPTW